jgi:tripartite-type tricarboxylate transporter receptor subunit TctC
MRGSIRVVIACAIMVASAARAEEWPARPIHLIVGFGAGGGTDIAARLIAPPLSDILGQPVVVENRPSAGGTMAAAAVAHAPKDGYTALMMSNAHAISAVMYKTLPYDPVNDFQMVSQVATAGLVLVTAPDFPAKTLGDLITLLKAHPGKYNFGSAGVGTTQQFASELMEQAAGLNVVHVPYRTTPAAVTGLLGKDVAYVFELIQPVEGQIKSGGLKAIAVTSTERNPTLPDVPTFAESGLPGYEVTSWYGVAFPSGTPPEIVDKTNKAMRQLLQSESLKQQVLTLGAVVRSSTPDELKAYITHEIAKWDGVRERAGIAREE